MSHAHPRVSLSFLVSQLGGHAAHSFTERLVPLGLTPQHVGILRMLIANTDRPFTQTALGERLQVLPSRLVVLLDQLADKGLVERRPNPRDRRSNHLHATDAGHAAFDRVRDVVAQLDADLFDALTPEDRADLERIVRQIAAREGLIAGVHPAYRNQT